MTGGQRFAIAAAAVGALLFTAFLVVLFAIQHSTIASNGMAPSFPAGARIVSLRRPFFRVANVQRGDVITFVSGRYRYVWRVIGMPGEAVEVRDGRVSIDGKPAKYLSEGDVLTETIGNVSHEISLIEGRSEPWGRGTFRAHVPRDHVFVLGDNRYAAADSRFKGTVPFDAIRGRLLFAW